jgi:hypothetical protein
MKTIVHVYRALVAAAGFLLCASTGMALETKPTADLSCGELRAPISEVGYSTTDRPPHPV